MKILIELMADTNGISPPLVLHKKSENDKNE